VVFIWETISPYLWIFKESVGRAGVPILTAAEQLQLQADAGREGDDVHAPREKARALEELPVKDV